MNDEVVLEVREIRHKISDICEHDIQRVVAYYREFEDELKRAGNHQFATLPGAMSNEAHQIPTLLTGETFSRS